VLERPDIPPSIDWIDAWPEADAVYRESVGAWAFPLAGASR
jgi:hypothetical protein